MHGGGPMMYRRIRVGAMMKYPEPFVEADITAKKPTLGGIDWIRTGLRERFRRNPQGGTGRPAPKAEPKPESEKSEIELYLERIGHVRR